MPSGARRSRILCWSAISSGSARRRFGVWSSLLPQQVGSVRPLPKSSSVRHWRGWSGLARIAGRIRVGVPGAAAVDELVALRAAVFEEPLVLGAGEHDGQVPDLAPGPAEGLLDGRPVAGEAVRAEPGLRDEDRPAVQEQPVGPGALCRLGRERVALLQGGQAELVNLVDREPGHVREGRLGRGRDLGQQARWGACSAVPGGYQSGPGGDPGRG